MFDNLFTLSNAAIFVAGGAAEVGGTWLVARIKTLAKNPTASLSADAITLVENLIDKKVAAAIAPKTAAPTAVATGTTTATTAA
jgi:hypothetical protein